MESVYWGNIIESFHGKLLKYIPRGPITAKSFIISMANIIKDSTLIKSNIKRHDYKTKTLISLADKYNNSSIDFKWYSYKEFYDLEKSIYKAFNENLEENEIEIELENINNIDEDINPNNLSTNDEIDNQNDNDSINISENEILDEDDNDDEVNNREEESRW